MPPLISSPHCMKTLLTLIVFLLPLSASAKVDLDKLSRAVAVAETGNCTAGVGKSKNNCHGIRGKKGFLVFKSPAASHAHFKAMWLRVYGDRFPTPADAKTYVGTSGAAGWLKTVTAVYNR